MASRRMDQGLCSHSISRYMVCLVVLAVGRESNIISTASDWMQLKKRSIRLFHQMRICLDSA